MGFRCFAVLLGLALGACSKNDDEQSESEPAPAAPSAEEVPAPASPNRPRYGPRPTLAEPLSWDAPESWQSYPASDNGPVRGQYVVGQKLEAPERVRVQIVLTSGPAGASPSEKVTLAETLARKAFEEIARESRQERVVNGVRVVLLELEGALRQRTRSPGSAQVRASTIPGQAQITAIVETKDAPYRIVAIGKKERVAEMRDEFYELVGSLKLEEE